MKLVLCALVGLAGCATAGTPGGGGGGGDDAPRRDGPQPQIDAPITPTVDMLMMQALSQTADNTVGAMSSLACGNGTYTTENSWYRVFPLTSFGITGAYHVTDVTFGVQQAGPGAQTVQIKLGTYAGTPGATLDTALITPLTSVTANVPVVSAGQLITTPITATVPAGAKLIVEVFSPDHSTGTTFFYVGASAGTEQAPAYMRAPTCSVTQPKQMKTVNTTVAVGALILSVNGTH